MGTFRWDKWGWCAEGGRYIFAAWVVMDCIGSGSKLELNLDSELMFRGGGYKSLSKAHLFDSLTGGCLSWAPSLSQATWGPVLVDCLSPALDHVAVLTTPPQRSSESSWWLPELHGYYQRWQQHHDASPGEKAPGLALGVGQSPWKSEDQAAGAEV